MNESPIQAPQAKPQPILPTCRIALGQPASDALRATGSDYLVCSPMYYPDDSSKFAIYCYSLPAEITRQIASILAGSHKATRIRPAKPAAPSSACHPSPATSDAAQANVSATAGVTAKPATP